MRKILLYTLMTLAAAGMASCEDFLTRDTYDQIGSDEFWKSETDLELYANGFIQKMIPGDGTITRGDIYADYCAVDIPTDLLRPDGNVSPDNQTGWAESNWTNLRRVNYMLDNMHKCKGRVSDEIYNHYEASPVSGAPGSTTTRCRPSAPCPGTTSRSRPATRKR